MDGKVSSISSETKPFELDFKRRWRDLQHVSLLVQFSLSPAPLDSYQVKSFKEEEENRANFFFLKLYGNF